MANKGVNSQYREYIESLLSPSEAGEMIGVSGQWITKLCRRGQLKAYKTGLGWLVDPEDFKRYAAERLKRLEKAHSRAAEFSNEFHEKYGEAMSELANR